MTERGGWTRPDGTPPAAPAAPHTRSPALPPARPATVPRDHGRTWALLGGAAGVALLAGLTAVVLLVAQSPHRLPAAVGHHRAAPAAPVTLTILAQGPAGFASLADEYAVVAPNVHLDVISVDGPGDLAEELQADLEAGRGAPDVVALDETTIGQFSAQAGDFVDLRTMPGGAARERDFLPWLWQRSQGSDGRQMALPGGSSGDALCYRRDLLARAGLPTDRIEVGRMWETWPEFVRVARDYTAATGKPFLDSAAWLYAAVLAQQPVGNFTADGRFAPQNGPRHAWNTVAPLTAPGITARLPAYRKGWEAGLRSGAFAVTECPYWMLADIEESAPGTFGQWDVAALPGGAGNWTAGFLAIPEQSPNAAEAWKLLSWYTRANQEAKRFKTNHTLPATQAGLDGLAVRQKLLPFFNSAPVGQLYGASVRGLPPQHPDPADAVVTSAVTDELWSVELGRAKLSEGWRAATRAAEQAIGRPGGTDT